ncbi:MAG: hypothetical protein KAH17_03055 [Bacteroidales bacterium]|nr:hypothetical protein [Bacteroidales bacterium]
MNKSEDNKTYARFESLGRAIPGDILTTDQIMSQLKIPGKFKFELLTGIKSRNVCKPDEDSFTLAIKAAKDCIQRSSLKSADIEMIISCSITRYTEGHHQQYEPSMSFVIKQALGITDARSFDVSNACAGMFTGVLIAKSLIEQGVIKNCLVVSGEFISSLIHNAIRKIKTPTSNEFASLTVGDAGSALIMEATKDQDLAIQSHGFTSQTEYNRLCTAQPRPKFPGAAMKTKAKQIHDVSIKNSIPIIEEAMKSFGIKYSDIDFLIPHQTSRAAIISGAKTYSKYFKGSPGKILMNLQYNGNTASTSHFICLYDNLMKGIFKPDDRILGISYASGIVFGVIVFKINDLIKLHGSTNP